MNILICAKQVPDVSLVTVDKEKKCLVLDGVASVLNPYDGYALEAAARIKDSSPETKIIALTLGDESCKTALKDCLGIAADKAYIASSSALEKSDSLGIAQLLAAAIKKIELEEGAFDAVFCGKQTVDGDGALVGAELAELLGYPQVTSALSAAVLVSCSIFPRSARRTPNSMRDCCKALNAKNPARAQRQPMTRTSLTVFFKKLPHFP